MIKKPFDLISRFILTKRKVHWDENERVTGWLNNPIDSWTDLHTDSGFARFRMLGPNFHYLEK